MGWTFGKHLQELPAVSTKLQRPPLSRVLVARIEIADEEGAIICVATGSGATAAGAIEDARARARLRAQAVTL